MHSFTFNGVNSRTYELMVSGSGAFNAPERDVSVISIPGRNGDLIIDNGRYKNIKVEYPGFIAKNFQQNARGARSWLTSPLGYKRLEDDYNTDEFRLARFVDGLEFEMLGENEAGETKVVFDCLPQRFLKSGENEITILSGNSTTLNNPTNFDSLPIIKVIGSASGSFTINGKEVSFSEIDGYVMIDSDLKRAYKENLSKNNTMTGDFPILSPGNNSIQLFDGITSIIITPRWWIL